MTIDYAKRAAKIDKFLAKYASVLAHQGSLVKSSRKRAGRWVGNYYRLECRLEDDSKGSVYLGVDGPLVAGVRRRLLELRKPLRQKRQTAKVYRHLRQGAKTARRKLAEEVRRHGLHLQGSEIRGYRHASTTRLARTPPDPSASPVEKLENRKNADQQL